MIHVAAIAICCLTAVGSAAGAVSAAPAGPIVPNTALSPGATVPGLAPVVPLALPLAPIASSAPTTVTAPAVSVPIAARDAWTGTVAVDGAHVRATPDLHGAIVADLSAGQPVVVAQWVAGQEATPDNPTWARLGDGQYIHSSVLRPATVDVPPPPADASAETGHWIDLNLTHQVAVAYEGSVAVHVARVSSGRRGCETLPGYYHIQRRVADETMASASLAGDESAAASYHIDHVHWTQYFTSDGKALHENYWKAADQIGVPSSHGCAGMTPADARFFWDWASVGTPIYAHN
jgi:lipoprotein-anchoring transpeptidase ErfK/SrfK